MTTVNKNQELAVFVCPNCNCHSVGDTVWLRYEGEVLFLKCENRCSAEDDEKPHLIVKFVRAVLKND